MSTYILTVDPGCFTMGACLWNKKEMDGKKVALPIKSMCIDMKVEVRNRLSPMMAMEQNLNALKYWFCKYKIVECYCEKPRIFQSARGFASSIQGHVQHMDVFRGMLYMVCKERGCNFLDVDVIKWKGQLPKALVNGRVKEIIGKGTMVLSSNESHDWDSCGIGLYIQGEFE